MTGAGRFLGIAACVWLTGFAAAQREDLRYQNNYKWDFQAMCSMDDLALWAGAQPEDIKISPDCRQGTGCLEVNIDLDKGQYQRIEHNFIDGFSDVGAYLHGMNGHVKDFTDLKAIEFSYKTQLSSDIMIHFSIWDRTMQWCGWNVKVKAHATDWQTVTVTVPADIKQRMDIGRTGGVTFEIQTKNEPVAGKIYFDDLKFINESRAGIIAEKKTERYADYPRPIHSLPLPSAAKVNDAKIIMYVGITNRLSEGDSQGAIAQLADSISRFRGIKNIEFWFYAGEWGFLMKDDDQLSPEEVTLKNKVKTATLDVAGWCENNKVPFYMGPGHISPIMIKADWMKLILDAAPTYCKGMFLHEYSPESNQPLQEMIDLLELLRATDKVMILNNQTSYWFSFAWPGNSQYRNAIINERYKDVFVPMWENLLPAAQGLCLGYCLGYWKGGLVNNWGVSVQSWGYANLNYGLTDQMPADWWLRMFVSAVAYGAKYVEIEPDWPFNGAHLKHELKGGYLLKLSDNFKLGYWQDSPEMTALRWFDDLLSQRALVLANGPEDLVSIPGVALQVAESEHLGKTGFFERALDITFNQSHCPTYYEMAAIPRKNNIFRTLYRSMAHYDQTFPKTPYGLVTIFPMEADTKGFKIFKTDGYGAFMDGNWQPAETAEPLISSTFIEASKKLPLTAENCNISVTKWS